MDTNVVHSPGHTSLGVMIIGLGLAVVWHGLRGGFKVKRGLLRTGIGQRYRIEGWRRFLAGLVVIGLGIALLEQSPLFLFLSLAIGFVEILEASAVIAVMKHDPRAHQNRLASAITPNPSNTVPEPRLIQRKRAAER